MSQLMHAQLSNGTMVPLKARDNGDGTFSLDISATIAAGDIEIGAVEIKNATTDDRASVDTEGQLATRQKNRPNFDIFTVSTGGVANTEVTGPSVAVPDGFGIFIEADSANAEAVRVSKPLESGNAGKFRTVPAGEPFPTTIRVTNLNKIAFRAPTQTNQNMRLIVEQVS